MVWTSSEVDVDDEDGMEGNVTQSQISDFISGLPPSGPDRRVSKV
jgi:hypothetical protein